MAAIAAPMSTTNVLSDQLQIDMGDRIQLLEPDVNPLCVFTKAQSKSATVATKFSWLEDQSKPRFDVASGAAGAGVTAINVAHGSYFQQWDQVLITRTGEQVRVDSVAGNTITVTRGIGSTAQAIIDTDELYIVGTAQPEGDVSKPSRSDVPSKASNNTQIFRTPFDITGSLQASGFQVSPNEWARQANLKGIEHAKDLELAFMFGRKSATVPAGNEVRTTGGVVSFIGSNQVDAGGELSEPEWNAFVAQVCRYGTRNKLAMASQVGIAALQKFPMGKVQVRQDETTYGINVSHFITPFGSVNLVYHRLMEGSKYGGHIIAVDIAQMKYRYLAANGVNRDTKVLPNRQANDLDGRKDEYLTEAGLECGLQKAHGVLSGITS